MEISTINNTMHEELKQHVNSPEKDRLTQTDDDTELLDLIDNLDGLIEVSSVVSCSGNNKTT